MTEKQLKNLSRTDLLELLLEQTKRADELQERVTELTERIADLRAGLDRKEVVYIQPQDAAAYSGAAPQPAAPMPAPAQPESSLTEFILEY